MSLIQLILLIGILFVFTVYIFYFRSIILDRIIALFIGILGALCVLFPALTTNIANILGVGRGSDLIFYVFIVFSAFIFIQIFSKIAKLNENQTELIRHLALISAKTPDCFHQNDIRTSKD